VKVSSAVCECQWDLVRSGPFLLWRVASGDERDCLSGWQLFVCLFVCLIQSGCSW
jgi:hypothetical protein